MFCRSFFFFPFVLFLLAIVLSVLLRVTESDYPYGIFKIFLFRLDTPTFYWGSCYLMFSLKCFVSFCLFPAIVLFDFLQIIRLLISPLFSSNYSYTVSPLLIPSDWYFIFISIYLKRIRR